MPSQWQRLAVCYLQQLSKFCITAILISMFRLVINLFVIFKKKYVSCSSLADLYESMNVNCSLDTLQNNVLCRCLMPLCANNYVDY